MIIGYARVSSNHQDTELQMQALRAAGCKIIFEEKASGRKTNRPILNKAVNMLEPGDELVIWKLDRIGRNVLHALLTFQSLSERQVNIRSITDGVDLSTASGRYNSAIFSLRRSMNQTSIVSELSQVWQSHEQKAGLVAVSLNLLMNIGIHLGKKFWRDVHIVKWLNNLVSAYRLCIKNFLRRPLIMSHRRPFKSVLKHH